MKTLLSVLRCPPGTDQKYRALHRLWLAAALTGLGCAAGLVTLALSATAYTGLDSTSLFTHYLTSPRLLALNLLPPVLVMWLVYFLTRRAWAAFLVSFVYSIPQPPFHSRHSSTTVSTWAVLGKRSTASPFTAR